MKRVKAIGALSLIALAASTSAVAIANDESSFWYGGAGLGLSKAKIHDERITNGFVGSGFTVNSIDDDDSDLGFKVFAGRQFNKYFAVEGGYFNLGEFGFTANTTPNGSLNGKAKFQGLNLDLVGSLPITDKFSALGRVGYTYTQTKDTFTGTGAVTVNEDHPKKNDSNYKLGLGAQYAFTDSLAMRGEWERYRVNDAVGNKGDIDMFTLGLIYRFGAGDKGNSTAKKPEHVEPVAAAPVAAAPVAIAAAPAPVEVAPSPMLVIVPVVARTEQYCSILDVPFEINQNTVQREANEKIDKVGTFMRKYPATTAVIEGHTDEVGNAADNMKLSQRRAENVVTYLVEKNGIARDRLRSVGYGSTRPVGDNKTQAGQRLNRRINAIIACATDIEGIPAIPARMTMALEMEFDTNRAEVRPQYRAQLLKLANFMKANPKMTATVEGHTSNQQGTHAQAMELSQRRAQNVVNELVNQFGIDRGRLFAAGYGDTRRFAYNTSMEGQQENRRVNVVLNYRTEPTL
ncbi:MAG: OmpA family protein [Burkholderiales bacterium]